MNSAGLMQVAKESGRPLLIALLYLILGTAWILFSDRLLAGLTDDTGRLTELQHYKGWFFVLASALLLYLLVSRITQRLARTNRTLRTERDFIHSVLEVAEMLVTVVDGQGRVVRFNRACEKVSGYRAEEVIGRPLWDRLLPPEQVEALKGFFPIDRERIPRCFESQWLTRSGRRRLIAWSTAVLDEDADSPYLIATGCDVTQERATLESLRSSEERYHRLIETAHDAILVIDADSGRVVEANPRAEQMLGLSIDRLQGLHHTALYPEEAAERFATLFSEKLRYENAVLAEVRLKRADGALIPVEMSTAVTPLQDKTFVQCVLRDISERLRAEAQLKKLSRVVEVSPNCVVITDADGNIEYCNPKFYEVTGYSAEEVIGRNPRILKSGETTAEEYRRMWETIRAGKLWYGEFHNRRKDGKLFWWLSSINSIKDAAGRITHYVNIAEDINQLKYAEQTIRRLAYFDPLTELPNRTLFTDRLEQAIRSARHLQQSLALLFLDIDRFKTFNDTLGHASGDNLLRAVARRLGDCLDEGATLARLGGDEFAFILPAVESAEQVAHFAQRLLAIMGPPFEIDSREIFVTVSIGISLFPDDTQSAEMLAGNADLAMFRAKSVGRNTYQFFTADMNVASFEQMTLEAALRRALQRDELVVYYQPKVCLRSGRITGMEALVRWAHPELGLISPGRFIPLAEETGLIVPLGEWVLRAACEQTQRWREAGHDLRVSVNLSAKQFRFRDLPRQVSSTLAQTGLPAAGLELEITEHDIMANAEEAVAMLLELKAMGVSLSIDDFGTGYSSLSYLKRFPIDILKIDQSFTRDLSSDADDAAIARAVIVLARSLRLKVIAEGVESAAQLAFYRREKADEAQGYFFSPPVEAQEFAALLAQTPFVLGEGDGAQGV